MVGLPAFIKECGKYNNYLNQKKKMQGRLLSVFNSFAFHNTTQILLASLTSPQLKAILQAIERKPSYGTLAHMIRATLVVSISHQVDRTLYFLHYSDFSKDELANERSSLVASQTDPQCLQEIAQKYCILQERINTVFDDEAEAVQEAVFYPQLALPPNRRSTVAPRCQTVFQIALACQKLEQSQNLQAQTGSHNQFFLELLTFQVEMANLQLSAITDPLEHFAQLTFRFMVYRNTVLSLHSIAPFQDLALSMNPWRANMNAHYAKANSTFAQIAGFRSEEEKELGNFTPAILRAQGYLNEYIEALVDLSIDQQIVAFCGHSRQNFGEFYSKFEQDTLSYLWLERCPSWEVEEWRSYGLKPSTLLKIQQLQAIKCGGDTAFDHCDKEDSYIESCALIHGFMRSQVQCS